MQAQITKEVMDTGDALDQVLFYWASQAVVKVSLEHSFDPKVRAAIQRIKAQHPGAFVREERVSMEEIARCRAQTSSEGGGYDVTEMQRMAQEIFLDAARSNATDIHIRVDKAKTEIYYRIYSDLVRMGSHPTAFGYAVCQAIYHTMADVSDPTFEPGSRQSARIGDPRIMPQGIDGIRIGTSPCVGGFLMVLRLLHSVTDTNFDLVELGFTKTQKARFVSLRRRHAGLILISGPTGSGKSTTLQRVLGGLIHESLGARHVYTIEDPPEYRIPGATQTPVTNATSDEARSAAFTAAIAGAMRLDPDVIMLGEIRDSATAKSAFEASRTGHQVWTSTHAIDAFAAIRRVAELGVPETDLCSPDVFSGSVSQRLLGVLCDCKLPLERAHQSKHQITNDSLDDDLSRFSGVFGNFSGLYVRGPGCKKCSGTGHLRNTAVAEVVVTDVELLRMVLDNDVPAARAHWQRKQQGLSMLAHALIKIRAGLVDPFLAEALVGSLDEGAGAFNYKERMLA